MCVLGGTACVALSMPVELLAFATCRLAFVGFGAGGSSVAAHNSTHFKFSPDIWHSVGALWVHAK